MIFTKKSLRFAKKNSISIYVDNFLHKVKKLMHTANVIPETLAQKRETRLLCFWARSTISNGCIDPLKSTVL